MTTSTQSLASWLLERIAEDEAVARESFYEEQHWYSEEEHVARWPGDDTVWDADRKRDAQHVVRWQPRRVLAECEAKRRIVDWHRLVDGLDRDGNPVIGCACCIGSTDDESFTIAGPCLTLRLLAVPYADREDYREEWKP